MLGRFRWAVVGSRGPFHGWAARAAPVGDRPPDARQILHAIDAPIAADQAQRTRDLAGLFHHAQEGGRAADQPSDTPNTQ